MDIFLENIYVFKVPLKIYFNLSKIFFINLKVISIKTRYSVS